MLHIYVPSYCLDKSVIPCILLKDKPNMRNTSNLCRKALALLIMPSLPKIGQYAT